MSHENIFNTVREQGYYKKLMDALLQGYYQADEQGYYKNAMTEQRDGPCKYLPSTNTTTRIREKVTPLIYSLFTYSIVVIIMKTNLLYSRS